METSMKKKAAWYWLPVLVWVALLAPTAGAQSLRPEMARVEAVADRTAYAPGETVRLAAVVTVEEGWHVNSHVPTYDWLIPTELTLPLPGGWGEPALTYPKGKLQTFGFADDPISVYDGTFRIVGEVTVPPGAKGSIPVTASLRYQACDDSSCLPPVTTEAELTLRIGSGGKPAHPDVFGAAAGPGAGTGAGAAGTPASTSLGLAILLAFLGGLILNVMPCVLPVLSIKVFGLVQSAGRGRSEVVRGGLATTAGILTSFWALAVAAVAARTAGAVVGWGTQFQHPAFVTFLTVVVVLFCLNLWGVFEISLPRSLARVGSSGPREGVAGHFASGLFATLMATPCSAPFLGTALGFALSQEAGPVFAVFTAIGLGMACPYLVLAAAPAAARALPKPGPWMDTVKNLMGFLLAGAAVWLLYVLASQVSLERLALIELGLLLLALFLWLRSRAAGSVLARRATGAVALAIAVSLVLLAPGGAPAASADETGYHEWVAFDRLEAERLAAEDGRLVFVDVTADWCLTCKTVERAVLETQGVAELFERHDVVPMKADWTNRNDEIGALLSEHGRAGIPFYLLYRPGRDPHVFGELVTRDSIARALEASAAGRTASR
jgi:suppressor for copper-sensitivity B